MSDGTFHHYKGHRVYVTGNSGMRGGWYPLGIILAPNTEAVRELKRIYGEEIFQTEEEAETRALELCKAWLDEHGLT